jgi:hypothetical protein
MIQKIRELSFRIYNNKIMQKNSNLLFRGILKTAPIKTNSDADTVVYCALSKPNCRAFILAAKSFLRYHNDVSVVVQDDGSLDDKCIDEIQKHILGAVVYRKDDMINLIHKKADKQLLEVIPGLQEYDSCTPIKILYLKFLNVMFRFQHRKVIIIDSDLLFLRKPDEVIQWIKEPYRRDFYGEGSNACADSYHKMGFTFKSLDIANFSSGLIGVYVKTTQDELINIFKRIKTYDPKLFKAWEIEQAVWSIVMSDGDEPLNLDELREVYIGSGWRTFKELRDKAILAHFAGAIRFKNLRYLRLAHLVINDLKI